MVKAGVLLVEHPEHPGLCMSKICLRVIYITRTSYLTSTKIFFKIVTYIEAYSVRSRLHNIMYRPGV